MSFIEVRTNPGMITTIVLPDSSRVWLNSESYLKYPVRFAKNERNVILQGEGYFSVRKNVDSRFTVQTPHHTQIQVLGTEFNVEAYEKEDEVNTTLVSGKVQFQYDSERGKKRMDLLPGEKITYNSISGEVFVSRAAVLSDISWKDFVLYGRIRHYFPVFFFWWMFVSHISFRWINKFLFYSFLVYYLLFQYNGNEARKIF